MIVNRWTSLLSAVSGCFFISMVCAETLETLSNSVFSNPRQPNVVFLHDKHNDMAAIDDCAVCHHVYENNRLVDDESSEDMACFECHLPVNFSKGVPLTAAYHKRCKGCHLSLKQGPIVCGQCHLKD